LFCKDFQDLACSNISEAYEKYYDVGMLYREVGLRDDAIADFQLSIKGGQRQLKGFEMLAISFLEQGDYGLASEVLNQGISVKKFLDNEYVGLHYNLGLANEQLGNRQKALEEYEQVYILDINYKDVAQRMRNLLEKNAQAQPQTEPPQLQSELAPADKTLMEAVQPLPEHEETTGIAEEPAPADGNIQPEPKIAADEAGLEVEYQELTAFQAQAEENVSSELAGVDEKIQAEVSFGEATVEVIMDKPTQSEAQTEPERTAQPAPAQKPDDEPYLGSNQQGLSFL